MNRRFRFFYQGPNTSIVIISGFRRSSPNLRTTAAPPNTQLRAMRSTVHFSPHLVLASSVGSGLHHFQTVAKESHRHRPDAFRPGPRFAKIRITKKGVIMTLIRCLTAILFLSCAGFLRAESATLPSHVMAQEATTSQFSLSTLSSCRSDRDCGTNSVCAGSRCTAKGPSGACRSGWDCMSNQVCAGGRCTSRWNSGNRCSLDSDCGFPNHCRQGRCL